MTSKAPTVHPLPTKNFTYVFIDKRTRMPGKQHVSMRIGLLLAQCQIFTIALTLLSAIVSQTSECPLSHCNENEVGDLGRVGIVLGHTG